MKKKTEGRKSRATAPFKNGSFMDSEKTQCASVRVLLELDFDYNLL
jgi:hypothetical protein